MNETDKSAGPLQRIVRRLRDAADEIAMAGHFGWGNQMTEAAAEIERLHGAMAVAQQTLRWVSSERDRLESAIRTTLQENAHLADGDNCTLSLLKRSLPTTEEQPPNAGGKPHERA